MRSRTAMASALALVVGACGGGTGSSTTAASSTAATTTTTTTAETTTTMVPGFEVASEDGDLTVEVPFEAMATDPGITIRVLAPEEFPAELAGAADDPDARIYQLEPEGLVFAAPVEVTRRIDASRFEGLTADMVPLVALVTHNPDGTYEAYADQTVIRRGEDVFVSGTTTHFSPAIAINLGGYVEARLDDYHFGYATEKDTSLQIGYRFYGSDLAALSAPRGVEPVGYTRSDAVQFGVSDSMLDVRCTDIGQAMPRMGVRFTLDADAPEGTLGMGILPGLMPTLGSLDMMAKIVADLVCLDPITSLILSVAAFSFSIATDHPGGVSYIPDENFYGGLSGAKLAFPYSDRLAGAWAGLICDNDDNGAIGPNDTFYAPWNLERDGDTLGYVAPLYGYCQYFVYLIDGAQYSGKPEGQDWNVGTVVSLLRDKYTGTGRFESSIGILATSSGLFRYEVGPEETQTTGDDVEVWQMLFGTTLRF